MHSHGPGAGCALPGWRCAPYQHRPALAQQPNVYLEPTWLRCSPMPQPPDRVASAQGWCLKAGCQGLARLPGHGPWHDQDSLAERSKAVAQGAIP